MGCRKRCDLFPHTPKHSPVLRYTGSKLKDAPVNRVNDSENMKPGNVPLIKEKEMAWNRF